MYDTLKIVDLNPSVPEDQVYDLLCEKFSGFSDVVINVVQQDRDRVAYLYFKSHEDAILALQESSGIAMFGYACHAVPVYEKPGNTAKAFYETADMYRSDLFRKSEDRKRASSSPDERNGHYRQPRGRGFRGRGFSSSRRGRNWPRGRASSRARGRGGKPYLLTPARSRSGQKPYLLTKPRADSEEKSPTRDSDSQKPFLLPEPAAADESTQNPNNTLYIGSMDSTVKEIDLQRLFGNFGFVLHVEIKHQMKLPSSKVCFAFVHFLTMDMATLAIQEMKGKAIGHTIPKLGYGRSVESTNLWVGGLGPWTSEDMLSMEFGQFGEVEKVQWPKNRDYAFIQFSSIQDATDAKQVMHGNLHGDPPHALRVCYATAMQMNSTINYKPEFPTFPRPHRPDIPPKKKVVSHFVKTRPEKRSSRDQESRESYKRPKRSLARSRSRSPPRRASPRRRSRSPRRKSHSPHRKSHSHMRSKKRERSPSPSPYTRNVSQELSDSNLSNISETSSESTGLEEQSRQRHPLSMSSRSPVNKLLRNPSPPKSAVKDERTVVLRSEPQPPDIATSGVYTSVMNPLHPAAIPAYVPPIDPVAYYPVPSTMYPPPIHMPPPDFYMPPNPMMPMFPPHLPPLASYAPVASDSAQPVPVVGKSSVAMAPTSTYLPSSGGDKLQPNAAPVKEPPKPASVSTASKFPKVWSGALVLRNAAFVVDMHLLSGSVLLVNSLLGGTVQPGSEGDCPVLKIAQRLRLDQPDKLDELDRRLKKAGRVGCSVLLATSAPAQVDDDANVVQQHPLSSLVSYLLQKQVAAVVSLPPGSTDPEKATGVLHAFPSCKFAGDFLKREAPGLPADCPTHEELLVVLCEL